MGPIEIYFKTGKLEMMKYFDCDFWKMTVGFLFIVSVGLAGVYLLNLYDQSGGIDVSHESLEAGAN